MSTETQKYVEGLDRELPHSAFEEFSRDERRPAVLLLAGLVIAALFFALGIFVSRWTETPRPATVQPVGQQRSAAPGSGTLPVPSPSTQNPSR